MSAVPATAAPHPPPIPRATQVAALLSPAPVAAVTWAVIAYESWRYAELRDRLRRAT